MVVTVSALLGSRAIQAAQEGEQQNRLDHPARVGLSWRHWASFRPAPLNPLTAG